MKDAFVWPLCFSNFLLLHSLCLLYTSQTGFFLSFEWVLFFFWVFAPAEPPLGHPSQKLPLMSSQRGFPWLPRLTKKTHVLPLVSSALLPCLIFFRVARCIQTNHTSLFISCLPILECKLPVGRDSVLFTSESLALSPVPGLWSSGRYQVTVCGTTLSFTPWPQPTL